MKKTAIALFVALVMGVTTFGIIETAYAQGKPAAGSGSGTKSTPGTTQHTSGTTHTPEKKHHRRKKHHRKHHSKKAETPSSFVMANQF